MGSCLFQCDVPHQWIAERQVGPVAVYCDGVGCHVLCLQHGIPVWQHIGQSTTAVAILPQMFKSAVNPKTKQKPNCIAAPGIRLVMSEPHLLSDTLMHTVIVISVTCGTPRSSLKLAPPLFYFVVMFRYKSKFNSYLFQKKECR